MTHHLEPHGAENLDDRCEILEGLAYQAFPNTVDQPAALLGSLRVRPIGATTDITKQQN